MSAWAPARERLLLLPERRASFPQAPPSSLPRKGKVSVELDWAKVQFHRMLTVLSDTVKTAFPEPSECPGKVEQDAASRWICEWHVHRTLEIQLRGKQVDLSYNTTPPTSHPFFLWAQRAFLALLLTMLKNRKIKWLSVIPVSTAIAVNPLAIVILSFIHKYINYKKVAPFISLTSSLSIKFYFSCYP